MSIAPEGINRIIPQTPQAVDERLARHQLRRELTYELERRQAFQDYCAWYRATAKQHQEELARWRGCSVAQLRSVTPRSPRRLAHNRTPLLWRWLRRL